MPGEILTRTVEDQAWTISALEICLARLERRDRRRSLESSSSGPSNRSQSSLGSPVRGSVWSGLGMSVNPYEVQKVEIHHLEEEDPLPVPPPPPHGGWGHYERTNDTLRDLVEILQVNPNEDSLPVPLRRPTTLDEEGQIINDPPAYEDPPSYS